jgi:Metal-dependent hydrolases of the beta-lactamase superfamily III
MQMEIIFVGTSSGKVNLNRFHSSIIVNSGKTLLLVDAGDSVSRALINAGIKPEIIDAVFITHTHADHFCGLPSLVTQMKMNGRKKPFQIIANELLIQTLKTFLHVSYIFDERMEFELQFIAVKNDKVFNVDGSLSFLTKQNSHLEKYIIYNPDSLLSLSSSSMLFNFEGKSILYTADLGSSNDLYIFKNEIIDYLICELTHIKAEELTVYIDLVKPKKTYLTHIDDELLAGESIRKLKCREDVILAEDGMAFTV